MDHSLGPYVQTILDMLGNPEAIIDQATMVEDVCGDFNKINQVARNLEIPFGRKSFLVDVAKTLKTKNAR